MYPSYDDIKSRIAEKPTWFDDNGVPRYGAFHPHHAPSIYAKEVALVEVGCQGCDETWLVSFTHKGWLLPGMDPVSLADAIRSGKMHYGNPPSHVETDHAGSTMNCIDWRVVEYWKHDIREGWQRDHALEIKLPDWNDEEWAGRRPKGGV